MTITDVTNVAVPSPHINERMDKLWFPWGSKSSSGEILRTLREQMSRKPKVMYVDQHKRETLTVSPEGNRPVMIGSEHLSPSGLIN